MEDEELALLWFDYNDISFSKVEKILRKFDRIDSIFQPNCVKNAIFDDVGIDNLKQKLLSVNKDEFANKVLNELYKYNITAITYASKDYPEKLKIIDDPPLVLYARGDISLLGKKSIAIVGTRKPTDYGRLVCEKFTKELSAAGLVTVSGLAYGIDTVVAKSTLDAKGKTIAVLAGGLDSIYPQQNASLAKQIEQCGLLVCEQRPKKRPLGYMFVARNRIVSALSLGTLIIEAGRSSGTMATARYAIEQGRELFVVPGNINSPESEGTNNLIDEMPDIFTISTSRILYKLKIKPKSDGATIQSSMPQVDLLQTSILNVLSQKEATFDELCEKVNVKASSLSGELIKLEMLGLIKKGDSNTYYKI